MALCLCREHFCEFVGVRDLPEVPLHIITSLAGHYELTTPTMYADT